MSDADKDQSFEDAFDELAEEGSELEASVQEEEEEDQSPASDQEGGDEDERYGDGTQEVAIEEDQLTAARNELQMWQHKYNSDLGRQHAFQKKVSEQQQYIQQLESQLKRGHGGQAAMTPDEWKVIQDDYPEIARGMQSYIGQLEARHKAEIESVRRDLQPIQQQAQDSFISDQFRILEMQHPDYREVAQSESFKLWVQAQPSHIQDMMSSNQAGDAAYLIRTYKNDLMPGIQASTELKQRREKQLRQAQTVPARGSRTRSNMPPEDDFEAAFEFFASR